MRIEWHRTYQDLHRTPADYAALVAKYDALLAKAPGNSALLYLRGRVDETPAAMHGYFTRSIQADPRNPYPLFGLAYDYVSAGDWTGGAPAARQGRLPLNRATLQFDYTFTPHPLGRRGGRGDCQGDA